MTYSPGGGAPVVIPAAAPFAAALTALTALTALAAAAFTAAATAAALTAVPLGIPVAAEVSPIVFLFLGLFHLLGLYHFLGHSNTLCEDTFFPWRQLKAWFASLAALASCSGTIRGIHACWPSWCTRNTLLEFTRLAFLQLKAWFASLAASANCAGTVRSIHACYPLWLFLNSVVFAAYVD